MTARLVLMTALAAASCTKSGPATQTAGPVQCGPEAELVEGRCVARESTTPPQDKAATPATVDVVGELTALSDKMCACQDRACAEDVNKEFEAWFAKNENASGTLEEQERAEAVAQRYTSCMVTAMGTSSKPSVDASEISEEKKKIAAQVVAMFDAVSAVVKKHTSDCGKMAAGIHQIAVDHRALIEKGKNMEDDAALRQWFDETYGERLKASMTETVTLMMQQCSTDEGVKKAFAELTGEA